MSVVINGDTGISGVNGSAATPAIQGGDADTGIFFGTDTAAITTGGTSRLNINSAGLATFTGQADFSGSVSARAGVKVEYLSGTDEALRIQTGGNLAGVFRANGSAQFGTGVPGGSGVAGTIINGSGSIETQAASGNVFIGRQGSNGLATTTIGQDGVASFVKIGVGLSSPDTKLHVKGTSTSGVEPLVIFENDTGTGGDVGVRITGGHADNPEEVYLEFVDRKDPDQSFAIGFDDNQDKFHMGYGVAGTMNSRTAVTVDNNGNFLLGTINNFNATDSTNPNGKFLGWIDGRLNIQSNAEGIAIKRHSGNGSVMQFSRGGTGPVGSISVSGSGTAFNETSDYRLKENIVDIPDGISRLKQLKPKRFNFILEPETTVDGFIAHEAQAVVPQSVTGTKDEVDEDGNPVMQGIDKSKFVPLLTAALQEAIVKIEALEQRLADAGIA